MTHLGKVRLARLSLVVVDNLYIYDKFYINRHENIASQCVNGRIYCWFGVIKLLLLDTNNIYSFTCCYIVTVTARCYVNCILYIVTSFTLSQKQVHLLGRVNLSTRTHTCTATCTIYTLLYIFVIHVSRYQIAQLRHRVLIDNAQVYILFLICQRVCAWAHLEQQLLVHVQCATVGGDSDTH